MKVSPTITTMQMTPRLTCKDGLHQALAKGRALKDSESSVATSDFTPILARASVLKRKYDSIGLPDVDGGCQKRRKVKSRSQSCERLDVRSSTTSTNLLDHVGLTCNDIAYIERLPGVHREASFVKNRPSIIQGLLNVGRQSRRLSNVVRSIQLTPAGESLPMPYEGLLEELHARIALPGSLQAYVAATVSCTGPKNPTSLSTRTDDESDKPFAVVIERAREQVKAPEPIGATHFEVRTIYHHANNPERIELTLAPVSSIRR